MRDIRHQNTKNIEMLTDDQAQECEGILTIMQVLHDAISCNTGPKWVETTLRQHLNKIEGELLQFDLTNQELKNRTEFPRLWQWMITLKEKSLDEPTRKRARVQKEFAWRLGVVEKAQRQIDVMQSEIMEVREMCKSLEAELKNMNAVSV